MALQSQGFQDVLNAIVDNGIAVRLYGLASQDFGTDPGTAWISSDKTLTWNATTPQSVNSTTWEIFNEEGVTFIIDPTAESADIRVYGVRLIDAGGQVLLEKDFDDSPTYYEFNVKGEFTLIELRVQVSST